MHIRQARPEDLPAIAALEARGFPPAEAASPESFAARFAVFPHCFFVAEDDGAIVGHINGCSCSIRASARPLSAIFWKWPGSGARKMWSSPARNG